MITYLAPNFTFDELTRTDQRNHIVSNREEARAPEIQIKLKRVAMELLQPIRNHYRRSVNISSGYRGKKLNRAVNGSSSSQHCRGEAADFRVSGQDLNDVFSWIRPSSSLKYGQLILECYDPSLNAGWIHISLPTARRQGQDLICTWDAQAGKWNYQSAPVA